MNDRSGLQSAQIQRCLGGLLAALLLLGAASATSSRAATLPGPTHFSTGLVDDPLFELSSNAVRSLWFRRARMLGSTAVRITADWAWIAPRTLPPGFDPSDAGDGHYDWLELDAAVREAATDGQTPVLLVTDAPTWAEAPKKPSYVSSGAWSPSPQALGSFARALALRYSGHFPDPLHPSRVLPHVRYFQAWNEPNLPEYLMPQWVRAPNGSIVAASPTIYRSLLNAFYVGVKAGQPESYVLAAGTAPYGDPPGVNRMPPLVFLRNMFCLTSKLRPTRCPDPPHFDALDHHPYAMTPTVHARIAGDVSVPDLDEIWRVLHAAERVGHSLPAGPKSLWVTEINWSTSPPRGLTPTRQARYLCQAFYEFWIQGVSHVFWFLLRDQSTKARGAKGGGLYLANGTAKPSATAFRFPFVALPAPGHELTLWGKAPTAGTVVIEKLVRHAWRPILHLTTTSGGVFYAQRRLGSQLQLRAQMGAVTSLAWATG